MIIRTASSLLHLPWVAKCCLMIGLSFLAACASLPSQGPQAIDIALTEPDPENPPTNYVVVPLDQNTLTVLNNAGPTPLPRSFTGTNQVAGNSVFGIGDELAINIWEPSVDGLFSTAENKQTALQAVVDSDGSIFVPYVGRVRAAGISVEALRRAITTQLVGKAVEPQVQVLLVESNSNSVVVLGDVSAPGRYPIAIRRLTLMEAIAEAGGTQEPIFETVAVITRGSTRATIRLDDAVDDSSQNVQLRPGDNVQVIHRPRSFSAFGAVGSKQFVPFERQEVTLAESLALVGGLEDDSADAGGMFLFRYESRGLVEQLATQVNVDAISGNEIPVIYRLDFNQPQAFFYARAFEMRDKDIIYVANAPATEFNKFVSLLLSPFVGSVNTASNIGD